MRRSRVLTVLAASSALCALLAFAASCLDDPREGESVATTESCDLAQLANVDPTSPNLKKEGALSLKTYVESAELLRAKAAEVETDFKDGCNALNAELGLPSGNDAIAACNPIAARIADLINKQNPNSPADWFEFRFASSCQGKPGTKEQCIAACSAGCDSTKCTQPQSGKCTGGACKGRCVISGDAVPCAGQCIGEVPVEAGTCSGECIGRCTAQAYAGQCEGSCTANFRGKCGGTCTGKCDGAPINLDQLDAGQPEGGSDAGADADPDAEAGPPPPTVLRPPPSNADGNCPGFCEGMGPNGTGGLCSSKAYGACTAPCSNVVDGGRVLTPYSAGTCGAACTGTCRAGKPTPSTSTCTGECTEVIGDECPGICKDECGGQLSNGFCEGQLACNQDTECTNACEARNLLEITCGDAKVIELYVAADPDLYAALQKHGARIAKAASKLRLVRQAFGFISNRTYGDFVAVGARGDLARVCVERGGAAIAAAEQSLRNSNSADVTVRKFAQ